MKRTELIKLCIAKAPLFVGVVSYTLMMAVQSALFWAAGSTHKWLNQHESRSAMTPFLVIDTAR